MLRDGAVPSAELRRLEVLANDAFTVYRELYYESTGLSSVYVWDLDTPDTANPTSHSPSNTNGNGFAVVVLLKKVVDGAKRMKGAWDGIHVLEVQPRGARMAAYKLTSTVQLHLVTQAGSHGRMSLAGSLTRQAQHDLPLDSVSGSGSGTSGSGNSGSGTTTSNTTNASFNPADHVVNIGRLVEDMENKLRNLMQEIYFGKTRDVVAEARSLASLGAVRSQQDLTRELISKMNAK